MPIISRKSEILEVPTAPSLGCMPLGRSSALGFLLDGNGCGSSVVKDNLLDLGGSCPHCQPVASGSTRCAACDPPPHPARPPPPPHPSSSPLPPRRCAGHSTGSVGGWPPRKWRVVPHPVVGACCAPQGALLEILGELVGLQRAFGATRCATNGPKSGSLGTSRDSEIPSRRVERGMHW
jgi:hypothetical protein